MPIMIVRPKLPPINHAVTILTQELLQVMAGAGYAGMILRPPFDLLAGKECSKPRRKILNFPNCLETIREPMAPVLGWSYAGLMLFLI